MCISHPPKPNYQLYRTEPARSVKRDKSPPPNANRSKCSGRRGRRAAAPVAGISIDSLVAAKQLVDQAGSAEAAVQAIGVLRRLQG
jgi:hypothetical protein